MRCSITVVLLATCLFKFGDTQITGWDSPSTISGAASGTLTTISKPEDTAIDATIATFTATTTSGAIASYDLLTAGTPFSLDSSGELTLSSALDFETKSSYVIEVKATDDNTPPNTGTATLTITVTDVNEAAPVFGQTSYTVCVADGSAADTSVTTFSASDEDTANTITYTIDSGDPNSDFKISTAELQVNTGKTLDMAKTAKYTLVVLATDDGTTAKTGTATYTVNVQASCNGATALTVTLMTLLLALLVSLN